MCVCVCAFFCVCVQVSSICAAPFSNICSTQADNSSWKLRLRCGCQFPRCALSIFLLICDPTVSVRFEVLVIVTRKEAWHRAVGYNFTVILDEGHQISTRLHGFLFQKTVVFFQILVSSRCTFETVMVRSHYSCSCWCSPGLCSSGDSSGFYFCS
jgi:hypothetical protein